MVKYTIKEIEARKNKYDSMTNEEIKAEYTFLTTEINKYIKINKLPTKVPEVPKQMEESGRGLLKILNSSLVINLQLRKKK